jgi:glucose-6-phosphate dehydrogenase assembly protein OpcA
MIKLVTSRLDFALANLVWTSKELLARLDFIREVAKSATRLARWHIYDLSHSRMTHWTGLHTASYNSPEKRSTCVDLVERP